MPCRRRASPGTSTSLIPARTTTASWRSGARRPRGSCSRAARGATSWPTPSRRSTPWSSPPSCGWRWCGAGALLGVAVVYRPVYLTLFLPALAAAWEGTARRRRAAVAGLVLGALAVAALSLGLQWLAGGDPTSYGGQRQGIYGHQGY